MLVINALTMNPNWYTINDPNIFYEHLIAFSLAKTKQYYELFDSVVVFYLNAVYKIILSTSFNTK